MFDGPTFNIKAIKKGLAILLGLRIKGSVCSPQQSSIPGLWNQIWHLYVDINVCTMENLTFETRKLNDVGTTIFVAFFRKSERAFVKSPKKGAKSQPWALLFT